MSICMVDRQTDKQRHRQIERQTDWPSKEPKKEEKKNEPSLYRTTLPLAKSNLQVTCFRTHPSANYPNFPFLSQV